MADIKKKHAKKRSQGAEIWRRLRKNKGAMVGLAITILIILLSLFADVIFDFDTQIAGINAKERLLAPTQGHPFGTDQMGRDLFYRVLYGTKYSFAIGILSTLMCTSIGLPLGAMAGYLGGTFDDILMRIIDIISSIPSMLMGMLVVSALGPSLANLVIAFGVAGAPAIARISRASVMTVKNQEYIEAARASGLREGKIIVSHILPNCLSPILVAMTLQVAQSIISASGLSFLGLGVPVPSPEWGALLSAGRQYIRDYSYMCLFPGLAIVVCVLALNMLGDGLRDAMDPKLRK